LGADAQYSPFVFLGSGSLAENWACCIGQYCSRRHQTEYNKPDEFAFHLEFLLYINPPARRVVCSSPVRAVWQRLMALNGFSRTTEPLTDFLAVDS
jgi:hypothetical protein